MKKLAILTALLLAGNVFLSIGVWAQQGTDDEFSPPPTPATEPAASHNYEANEPTGGSEQQAADEPVEHPSDQPVHGSNDTSKESIPLATSKPAQQQTLVSSSALVGTAVKNLQGEKVGDIRELMIDPQTGRIVYAVMASGGVLGMGEKSLAVPWETFKVGLEKDELVVQIDKDKLQSAPTYEVSQR